MFHLKALNRCPKPHQYTTMFIMEFSQCDRMRSWNHLALVLIIIVSSMTGLLSEHTEDPNVGPDESDVERPIQAEPGPISKDSLLNTLPLLDEAIRPRVTSGDGPHVNIEGSRSDAVFLKASKLNFDPWDPEDGEIVNCSATIGNYGAGGQIATGVNIEFYVDDRCIGAVIIDEIQPGERGTAWIDWKAGYGNHRMKVIADADGSDGGPTEVEATLNIPRSTYSPVLSLPYNSSWIKNLDTNHYYINVTNQGTDRDSFDLDLDIRKFGESPGGWSISLDQDSVTLDGGESTYVELTVDYTELDPDFSAEAVVTVTAESQSDPSKACSITVTTNVIHDKPILFIDDDGQHTHKGANDPILPGELMVDTGTWGGSYGSNSDHLMNASLDAIYPGLWEYVVLPGDSKQGKWATNTTLGPSGPVFNSGTPGFNPTNYPYQDRDGDDIFLKNYDVVIWNLGYSETLTADPNGTGEPASINDDWWDQKELETYLNNGGNLWLTGNAMSFYLDQNAPLNGMVTNQFLRDYFQVERAAHGVGIGERISGVSLDPIGNRIDVENGQFYGSGVVDGERGNAVSDWVPMGDARGVFFGNGDGYSTVRYEHQRESHANRRFKTVLQSGGFENFGDIFDLTDPIRLNLVEQTLTWLGVPPAIVPEYDIGVLGFDQPREKFLQPGNAVPIHITLKNYGQKEIRDTFDVKCKVTYGNGDPVFQKTRGMSEDIVVGHSIAVSVIWSSNLPQEGDDFRISALLENFAFQDSDPANDELSIERTAQNIVDIGTGAAWFDTESPWNAIRVARKATFHATVENHGSSEQTFPAQAVIRSPTGPIVFNETHSVTLLPGRTATLDWTWTPRLPGGLGLGSGGHVGDVIAPYVVNISVNATQDDVVANNDQEFELLVMAFSDGSEPTSTIGEWTPVDLGDHNDHGNSSEQTPWHLSDEWAMSGSYSWKASNSQGQLRPDWNTCLISPKISLDDFTSALINNVQSGQLGVGSSCFLEISLDHDGNPDHVEGAEWTPLWSRSGEAMGTWITWDATDLSTYLGEEFYLRYRLTTTEGNNVGWYVDDLVITGNVRNYTKNDIGVSMVSIDPLITGTENSRDIDVTVHNYGENRTNAEGRPGFTVRVSIENDDEDEVYNETIPVDRVLENGDSHVVSFDGDNGKDWVPGETGEYQIRVWTEWQAGEGKTIDENPQNDEMVIDGIVNWDFFSDDMEHGGNEWVTDDHPDGWELGTPIFGPVPHSGESCWGTTLDGNYPDLVGGSITLEHQVDLKRSSDPILRFWHWLEVESNSYDSVFVEARIIDESEYTILWTNPDPEAGMISYHTNGWEIVTLDLEDFAHHEIVIRFRLESDGDTSFSGWYIDDLMISGSPPPSYDAMVVSIDYPTNGEYISPSDVIEIHATIMNVGLNPDVIPVTCQTTRQGSSPVTYDLGDKSTTVLQPGEKAHIVFIWQLPIGTYQYRIQMRTELKDDGNSRNDELDVYIWAKERFDIAILNVAEYSLYQEVGRTREVSTEVQNVGNTELMNNVEITFEAIFEGKTVDEYSTLISLSRGEITRVTWEWQSFKYGEYTILVSGSIIDESESEMGDNIAILEGVLTVEILFSDNRENDEGPQFLDPESGEFIVWDWVHEGGTFWTGDNETDPMTPGWHEIDMGHFSRKSWYCGVLSQDQYSNNMDSRLISKPLDLEGYTDVQLSFFTSYQIEGGTFDSIDISISSDRGSDTETYSWESLLRYPGEHESMNSQDDPNSTYGWLQKNVIIPEEYLTDSFSMRILMRSDNTITSRGVWIDDITLYGKTAENHAPVARFTATADQITDSFSRHVIRNPTIELQGIQENYDYNNVPLPVGGNQGGILLGHEIHFNAELSYDPDVDDAEETLTYRWDFGDGYIRYGPSVTHIFDDDPPPEGYFRVILKVTDEKDAFSEDSLLVWIGNKPPVPDYYITTTFDTSARIDDENDGVENGLIDVFYGDQLIFWDNSTDPEDYPLSFLWDFRCVRTGFQMIFTDDTISGSAGENFLYEGLDGSDPIIPDQVLDYNVSINVNDGISVSKKSYIIRVHPLATVDFAKLVNMGPTVLEATVSLTWRGFPEEAAPHASLISLDRPVFVYIDDSAHSPDPNFYSRGGIGKIFEIRAEGCFLQNGEEGVILAEIRIPILTSDLEEIGDPYSLQDDLRLGYYDELEKRFVVVEESHVIPDGGVKYVVGTVDHFSIFAAMVDVWGGGWSDPYPDLSVQSIEFSRSPVLNGQEVEIRAEVRNTGSIHARNVDVKIYHGDDLIGDQRIDIVSASGGTFMISETFTAAMVNIESISENHYIQVFVNKQHAINEGSANYKNNERSELLVVVRSLVQPPPPQFSSPHNGDTVYGDVTLRGTIPQLHTTVTLVYQPFGNNDLAWHVERVNPNSLSILLVNFTLIDDYGSDVAGGKGRVSDIYGLNFDDPTTHISFQDNDRDGKLSAGDVFLVKSIKNGGLAMGGYSLELDFGNVDSVELSINDGEWFVASGTGSWGYQWDTTSVQDGEYRVKARSSNGYIHSDEVSIRITVDQSSWEAAPIVVLMLVTILGLLALILLSVIAATFDTRS